MQPIPLQERRAAPPRGFALWRLGFRPFYFLAAVFAAVSVALWALQYAGWMPWSYLTGPLAHGHEMVFGFALAVVAGFLFTAVRNWTGQPTPVGPWLVAVAALWLAGRVLEITPYATAAAWVRAAFPIAIAVGIAIPLLRSGNRRNYFFVALLVLFAVLALALHALDPSWQERAGLPAALDAVLFLLAVMGGRVIPMFTNNGVPGLRAIRHPRVERAALGSVLVLLAADALGAPPASVAVLCGVAALAQAVRLYLWQPWGTGRVPLVWVLHAAYAWIVVHLVLRVAVVAGMVAPPIAIHALAVGSIGGMTLGMMTRTAKGHTARPLLADRYDLTCFLLVNAAALVRVFGGLLLPQEAYAGTVVAAGLLWSGAYGLYAVRYWPVLSRPRLDGAPG